MLAQHGLGRPLVDPLHVAVHHGQAHAAETEH